MITFAGKIHVIGISSLLFVSRISYSKRHERSKEAASSRIHNGGVGVGSINISFIGS